MTQPTAKGDQKVCAVVGVGPGNGAALARRFASRRPRRGPAGSQHRVQQRARENFAGLESVLLRRHRREIGRARLRGAALRARRGRCAGLQRRFRRLGQRRGYRRGRLRGQLAHQRARRAARRETGDSGDEASWHAATSCSSAPPLHGAAWRARRRLRPPKPRRRASPNHSRVTSGRSASTSR